APKAEAREAAEKALIGLGARALPLLPDPAKVNGAERRERLDRGRAALRDAQSQANLDASRVTVQGEGVRLTEGSRPAQGQTGEPITDMREQQGEEVTNPSFALDIKDLPFFEALDMVVKKAEVAVTFFTGDGTIGIVSAPMPQPNMTADTSKSPK